VKGDEKLTTNNLKEIRIQKGISQQQLSFETRISPGVLSHIENGKIFAYPGWRKRIAKALKMPEEVIFPGVDRKEEANFGEISSSKASC
jgi:putative transcriptional regulator